MCVCTKSQNTDCLNYRLFFSNLRKVDEVFCVFVVVTFRIIVRLLGVAW